MHDCFAGAAGRFTEPALTPRHVETAQGAPPRQRGGARTRKGVLAWPVRRARRGLEVRFARVAADPAPATSTTRATHEPLRPIPHGPLLRLRRRSFSGLRRGLESLDGIPPGTGSPSCEVSESRGESEEQHRVRIPARPPARTGDRRLPPAGERADRDPLCGAHFEDRARPRGRLPRR